jgi:hypothetical protein
MKKISEVLPYSQSMLKSMGFDAENPLELPNENVLSRRRITRKTEGANTPYETVVAIPTLNGIKQMRFTCWAKPGITPEEIASANFRWHWDDRSEDYDPGMVAHFVVRNLDDEEIVDEVDED